MKIRSIFNFGRNNVNHNLYENIKNYYKNISHNFGNNLIYTERKNGFQVTNGHIESPYPGIKIHTMLNDKLYNVLLDKDFINSISHGWIFGFKLYNFGYIQSYKQLTIYIGFKEIYGYYNILKIFRKHGIKIDPKFNGKENQYILLNRLYISDNIFVRYSTDIYDKLKGDWRIIDTTWRFAEDKNNPLIFALSREFLIKNFYSIINDLNNKNKIYTVIKLYRSGNIVFPAPEIIINFDWNKLELITYDIVRSSYSTIKINNQKDLQYISNDIFNRIKKFLSEGYL
jgi:hypothetical protein